MTNISPNNIFIINKKIKNKSQKQNKSSLETNRTYSSNIKSSDNSYRNNFYKKFINKILFSKYNTLPKDHDMILLENVIQSKYCRDLAVFKEKILFNYNEEFLRRYYKEEESKIRIPKFVIYYKNYLIFFCRPIFSELNLNDLIQVYSEKKAQIFYNENYKDDINYINENKNNYSTLFTPKIRKLISNNNSLSNLSITNLNQDVNNESINSTENSIMKIIIDLNKKPIKNNKIPLNKEKRIIKDNKVSKNIINNSNSSNNNQKDTKNSSLGKNLFFIYNQNFKKIISNHIHTKTGTNLNVFKEKVLSERKNSKQKSNSKISFSKNKKKRSRNLIISNPLLTDLGIYTYRYEKDKKILEHSNYNTINSMNLTEKRNLRSVTERNNKNLIKVIKQVENNKKSRNNVSRNINRNSINSSKGNLGLNIYSSAFIKSKNEVVNINDMFLKTDYNEKKKKVKNNLNAYQGFSQIKKYIQNQRKFLKK